MNKINFLELTQGTKFRNLNMMMEVKQLIRLSEGGVIIDTVGEVDSTEVYHFCSLKSVDEILEKGKGKLIIKKEKNLSWAHFPVGTIFEASKLRPDEQFEVKSVWRNGAYSYILKTTKIDKWEFNTHDDLGNIIVDENNQPVKKAEEHSVSINISHVTRIVKRGDGAAGISEDKDSTSLRNIYDNEPPKGKGQYKRKYSLNEIVYAISRQSIPKFMTLDIEKLINALEDQGVIQKQNVSFENYEIVYLFANKKKLKRTIRRNLNRFLMPLKQAYQIDQDLYRDYDLDMESLFDNELAYDEEPSVHNEERISSLSDSFFDDR